MNKRNFLHSGIAGVAGSLAAAALPARAQHAAKTSAGPVLLTVSGLIGPGNRGPLDPALDQMMVKHKLAFSKAQTFDFAALTSMPSVTIQPTLEYDQKPHALRGPRLTDVIKASGVKETEKISLLLRAVDAYAVLIPIAEVRRRQFIVATHLDDRPMSLGGLGPLWVVYEADKHPDMMARPIAERFSLCPWATYHVEVKQS